tara:strand:+ start:331 stop:669 length:339 start_codon:yes stop_codon:yes gene_type:complete
MPSIEVVSTEEHHVWNARKAALTEHSSYKSKQQYFPNNMDEWQEKGKEIERRYRQELLSLNKQRKEEEKPTIRPTIQKQKPRKAIQEKKTIPTRCSVRQAAKALLELKTPRY